MGLICGEYGGRSDEFQPGGVSLNVAWSLTVLPMRNLKAVSAARPPEMQISKGAIALCLSLLAHLLQWNGHGRVRRSMSMIRK